MTRRESTRLRSAWSGAGAVAVGTSVANVLGYALTVVGARRLGPEEFGAFSALLALVIVGNVAALAVQATTARAAARHTDPAPAVRAGILLAVAVGSMLALASPVFSKALQLGSAVPALAAAVAIAAVTVTAPALGVTQGHERFAALAALVAGQAVLRVGGGLVAMAISPTAQAAMTGIATGFVVAAVLAWIAVRPPVREADGTPVSSAIRTTLVSGAMLLGFVVLTNIDVMLARHVLPEHTSGLYAAGSIFTKVAFWLPQFVPLLAFPAMTDPDRRHSAMRRGLVVVAGCGVALVVGTAALSEQAVLVVAGPSYLELAPWVGGFTALGALYALAHLLVYAQLARGDRWTIAVVWVALTAYVVIVETTASGLGGVLVPGLGAAATIVVWGLVRERVTATSSAPTASTP